MSESDKPLVNDDPFQNRKKLDTATVLDEIGRSNHATPKRSSAGARASIGLLFVMVLTLAGATAWLGYQQWLSQDRYAQVVAEVGRENARLQQVMTELQAELAAERAALQAELTGQTALLRDSNSALQEALAEVDAQERLEQQRLDRLQQQISRDQDNVENLVGALQRQVGNLQQRDTRWLNAEANYLMRLAQQKLQLEADIESTVLLLRTIDSLLADQNGTLVETVRQNLADDLRALQDSRLPDRAALSQRLAMLGDNLEQLTLAGSRQESYQESVQNQWQSTPGAAQTGSWLDAGLALLRSIFVWRQWDEAPTEMLPPQQETMLKQQLLLQLEQAQLAMLQGDEPLYQQILAQAIRNLQRYFESGSERSRQLIAELERLQAIELEVALPDLAMTADLLRQLATASAPAVNDQPINQ